MFEVENKRNLRIIFPVFYIPIFYAEEFVLVA